jgi:pyruvate,water dikinase
MPAEPLQVMVSFGAIQGLLDPITPFGRDGISLLAASVSNLLGYPSTLESQRAFVTAGERIFTNATPLLRNRIGRNLVPRVLGAVEPGSQGFIKVLLNDPQFTPGHAPLRPQTAFKLLRRLVPMVFRMLGTLLAPERARTSIFADVDSFCQWVETSGKEADTLAKRLDWLERIFQRLPRFMLERMIPTFAPGVAMWVALDHMAAELPQGERQVMEVTRGLPFNVTTEMDLALWETARAIQSDAAALAAVQQGEAAALAADFQAGRLPVAAQAAVQRFLARYGVRGVAEIDIGRTRWGENPTPIFQALKSYIQITDLNLAPDAIFRRSAQSAEAAIAALTEAARQLPRGRLKAWRIRGAAARVRALAGLRELPKFFAIRVMGLVRAQLLQSGADLVAAGLLERPEHIFFLRIPELRQLAKTHHPDHLPQGDGNSPPPAGEGPGVRVLVAERLQANQREQRRRQVPRLLLSDGRAIFEGVSDPGGAQDENVLVGSPVSPGVVDGVVHVVLDPHREQLAPGEILVCPGTDPAWTPLFLAAGGLVMEVGGLMTHGSVVAREYGIPAVVGVSQATMRLKNGQKIRVDGNNGKVIVL